MARPYGDYSPVVPLGATWEESIALTDSNGNPINLTGYAVRSQLRSMAPTSVNSVPTTNPALELTTASYYGTLPAWPVYAGWSVPTPTNGTLILSVPVASFANAISPTNARIKLYWEVKLVIPASGYTLPVVSGLVTFLPAITV